MNTVELEYKEKLSEISKQMKEGVKPQPVTARTFIGWFGAQRRTSANVNLIRSQLREFQLETQPDFESIGDVPLDARNLI